MDTTATCKPVKRFMLTRNTNQPMSRGVTLYPVEELFQRTLIYSWHRRHWYSKITSPPLWGMSFVNEDKSIVQWALTLEFICVRWHSFDSSLWREWWREKDSFLLYLTSLALLIKKRKKLQQQKHLTLSSEEEENSGINLWATLSKRSRPMKCQFQPILERFLSTLSPRLNPLLMWEDSLRRVSSCSYNSLWRQIVPLWGRTVASSWSVSSTKITVTRLECTCCLSDCYCEGSLFIPDSSTKTTQQTKLSVKSV